MDCTSYALLRLIRIFELTMTSIVVYITELSFTYVQSQKILNQLIYNSTYISKVR